MQIARGVALVTGCLLLAACANPVTPTPTRSSPTFSATPSKQPPATPTSSAAPSLSASPGASGADVPRVPLSLDVDLPKPPIWGVPKPEGWEMVVFDQQGLNKLEQANGCTLSTVQNAGVIGMIDDKPPTDVTATKQFLKDSLAQTNTIKGFTTEGEVVAFPVRLGLAGTQAIDFAQLTYSYNHKDTGARWRTIVLARVMPKPGSQLIATLACPVGDLEAARPILDQLKVVPG